MAKINLEKKMEKAPQRLIDLSKKLQVSIEKKQLSEETAKVALVLDASRSMVKQYLNGDVQKLVDRIIPIGVQFDDDGELDVWRFSDNPQRLENASLKNIDGYIERNFTDKNIKGGNNEPAAVQAVLDEFAGEKLPVYVIFISDGGVNRSKQIRKIMIEASEKGFFWQFVGLGGKNYGILAELDNMEGRKIDNANFFALDDIEEIGAAELYERLLNEYPQWLTDARKANIISKISGQTLKPSQQPQTTPKAAKQDPLKEETKPSFLSKIFPFLKKS